MFDPVLGQPYLIMGAIMTAIAAIGSQGHYWLGRAVRAGRVQASWAQKHAADKQRLAGERLELWGWPLIPISYLMIGMQTAVQMTAGLTGWRWGRYTLASVIGWVVWGAIYGMGGMVVLTGVVILAIHAWWMAAVFVFAITTAVVLIVRLRRAAVAVRECAGCATLAAQS